MTLGAPIMTLEINLTNHIIILMLSVMLYVMLKSSLVKRIHTDDIFSSFVMAFVEAKFNNKM